MTEAQLTATKIPVNDLLNMLAAVGNRNYSSSHMNEVHPTKKGVRSQESEVIRHSSG